MRDIFGVVEAIKKTIPQDFNQRSMLFFELDDRLDSVKYTAPEAMHIRWQEIAGILGTYLGAPDSGWKRTVAEIYADSIDYREINGK